MVSQRGRVVGRQPKHDYDGAFNPSNIYFTELRIRCVQVSVVVVIERIRTGLEKIHIQHQRNVK